jgi:beta-galactosidase
MNRTVTWYCRSLAVVSAVFAVALALVARVAAADDRAGHRGRQVIDLDQGWRFALANPAGIEVPPGFTAAHLPGYDDSSWRTLDVPHDWSIELAPVAGPGTSGDTGFLPGGLGFYRKRFALSPRLAGRTISIEFDGVSMNSEI